MNVENNGPTLVTMIQLGKIFIFYISFSISWSHRQPREILLILSEEATKSIMSRSNPDLYQRSYQAINPCMPWARSCQHPSSHITVCQPGHHWLPGLARAPIGPLAEILTVRRDESTNQP